MPHKEQYKHIQIKELHPTFVAEVIGVDFSDRVSDEVFAEILDAITQVPSFPPSISHLSPNPLPHQTTSLTSPQYGVLVFRKAKLDDRRHVEFSARFGELDDVRPYLAAGRKNRFPYDELFDVSNQDDDGNITDPNSRRAHYVRGNSFFHVDSSFNPRRAGYSLLRAHQLPPKGTGGETAYADTRTAWADLPEDVKGMLLEKDYVAAHSLYHSRKKASPVVLADLDPLAFPMGRHKLVQRHEASGRMNLYNPSHVHHLEGIGEEEGGKLLEELYKHATGEKYVCVVEWENDGDLIVWDNTCVMHRAMGGSYEGRFKRDMRRATVHDGSSTAWGLNEHVDTRQGLP